MISLGIVLIGLWRHRRISVNTFGRSACGQEKRVALRHEVGWSG